MRLRFEFDCWFAKELTKMGLFLQLVIGVGFVALFYSGRPDVDNLPGVWLITAITILVWLVGTYLIFSIDLRPWQPPPNGRKPWPVPPASSFSTAFPSTTLI